MSWRVYISISYSKRSTLDTSVQAIVSAVNSCDMVPFVFVDQYRFDPSEEQAMMKQAMDDIVRCDLLIAETSEKAIGIGAEAGYAKGKGKPVIYLRHVSAEHSTTVSGMSDYQVIYADAEDLREKLITVLMNEAQRSVGAMNS